MSNREPDWKYTPPAGGWFQRHLAWSIPVLILLILLPIACCGGGIWWLVQTFSAPYYAAMEQVQADPVVLAAFGSPLQSGRGVEITNWVKKKGKGACSLSFVVIGPKGQGSVRAEMEAIEGAWTARTLQIVMPDGTTHSISGEPNSDRGDAGNGPSETGTKTASDALQDG